MKTCISCGSTGRGLRAPDVVVRLETAEGTNTESTVYLKAVAEQVAHVLPFPNIGFPTYIEHFPNSICTG